MMKHNANPLTTSQNKTLLLILIMNYADHHQPDNRHSLENINYLESSTLNSTNNQARQSVSLSHGINRDLQPLIHAAQELHDLNTNAPILAMQHIVDGIQRVQQSITAEQNRYLTLSEMIQANNFRFDIDTASIPLAQIAKIEKPRFYSLSNINLNNMEPISVPQFDIDEPLYIYTT